MITGAISLISEKIAQGIFITTSKTFGYPNYVSEVDGFKFIFAHKQEFHRLFSDSRSSDADRIRSITCQTALKCGKEPLEPFAY